jgi:hypothetical protein
MTTGQGDNMMTETGIDPLAKRVRVLMASTETTLRKLGSALGVSESGVAKMLARPGASTPHAAAIAKFFGISEADLISTRLTDDAVVRMVKGHVVKKAHEGIPVRQGAMVRLTREPRGKVMGSWALIAAKGVQPTKGSLVALPASSGWILRVYAPSDDDSGAGYLVHPNDSLQVQKINEKDSLALRMVLLTGELAPGTGAIEGELS